MISDPGQAVYDSFEYHCNMLPDRNSLQEEGLTLIRSFRGSVHNPLARMTWQWGSVREERRAVPSPADPGKRSFRDSFVLCSIQALRLRKVPHLHSSLGPVLQAWVPPFKPAPPIQAWVHLLLLIFSANTFMPGAVLHLPQE